MSLVVCTPFGRPVAWAEVSAHDGFGGGSGLDDLRYLVVSGRRLGQQKLNLFDDFLLCVVAQGVTRRASQLALAAFVGSFLGSGEVDGLWRLRDAVRAADARLMESLDGPLSSTLTAVVVAGDGTAYGVSVGDSPLLVSPAGTELRVQVLGRDRSTGLGLGQTLDAAGAIEQWWRDSGGDGSRTRLEPGTALMLAGRDKRTVLDVRFGGGQVFSTSGLVANAGWLVSVVGCRSGSSDVEEWFGLVCLGEDGARGTVAGCLGMALEVGSPDMALGSPEELARCLSLAGGDPPRARLAVVACRPDGGTACLGWGGASAEPALVHGQTAEDEADGRRFTLRLGAGSDPLDRGILIAVAERGAPISPRPPPASPPAPAIVSALRHWLRGLAMRASGGRRRRSRF